MMFPMKGMVEQGHKDKDPLRIHDLAEKLAKHPREPANAVRLVGYVGKSDSNDILRLYLNLNFNEYVDIPRNKILYAAEAPEKVLEFGGTYIWVSKDTDITHVRVESTKQQAKFLEGRISRKYMRRGISGLGYPLFGPGPPIVYYLPTYHYNTCWYVCVPPGPIGPSNGQCTYGGACGGESDGICG
jgi:hypothetical protein